jgi:sugar lactone lactonase YvrE
MNDGKADPAGRFVGGAMTLGTPRPGAGSLWSFGPDGPIELVTGVTASNGLAWSTDGETLFFIDTPTRRVDAFDYDAGTGRVSGRRTVVTIEESAGDPDGMCVAVDGGLWIAMWGGSAVRRYGDGGLDSVIEVPTPYVPCPVFTGRELDELVITTASQPFGDEAPPGAGDLHLVRPGVAGAVCPPRRPRDGHGLITTQEDMSTVNIEDTTDIGRAGTGVRTRRVDGHVRRDLGRPASVDRSADQICEVVDSATVKCARSHHVN